MAEETGAPAPRRRWSLWLPLGLVAALVLCVAPVGVGVVVFRGLDTPAWPATPAPKAEPARSPVAGDAERVTAAWLRDQIGAALTAQGAALLGGDQAKFVGTADPASPAARTLRAQFASLRAMKISRWSPSAEAIPSSVGPRKWRALVEVDHCFVEPDCAPMSITYGTVWADTAAGLKLTAIEPSMSTYDGPRPWEVDQLVVATGKRVVVATTQALRGQLKTVLAEAERAAVVADRYAVGGPPPSHYEVFYAGPAQWKRWFGGKRPSWTAGYALPVGGDQVDVVINAAAPQRNNLDDLLRHEMTHAATMPANGFPTSAWWLVEGIAELAASGGAAPQSYEGIEEVRKVVRERGWSGPLQDLKIADGAADWEVAGAYGIGYLAVRQLAERFGEPDVLAFMKALTHDRLPIDDASREVFGEPWSLLNDQCVAAVRAAAG
ncbi:hypothetical protein O7635_12145 [Asanoa sp. WMMD1127]|uniref:hypothetical protein n=1 Tax=Asanoa sp. WMMD1127 TaxID=3016107 RepID=UPI0024180F65|nr:hypothetical protein [Asanoa sp. WMMD1127]MDG4822603.1 hypothetical protein [Asanoa sp. WMMD1127]